MFKKYRLTVFVVIMMVVILGFASSAFAGQTLTGSFEHGPYTRTYYYYVPDSYDGSEPVPLLMAFHGMGGSGSIPTGNFNSIADEEGFIVVYPSSTTLTDVGPYGPMLPQIPVFISGVQWDPGIGIALQYYPEYEVDDVGFVSRLIDVLSEEFNIDQTRVYATGFSSGSMFSWNLAMNLSDKIAAVAPVSSPMTLLFLEQEPVRPITVIAAGGDSDNVVPFHGGPCYFNALQGEPVFASFYDSGAYWVEKNGIDTEPVVDRVASNILRTTYSGGHYGTEVILYHVEGGGHAYYNLPQLNSRVIWNHLKEHSLPEYDIEWLPPLTAKGDYVVKNGTTLPLKFQLLGFADGNVVEDIQDIFVTIEGEGLEQTWELGSGRNALRFDERECHYILNFHTKDYELVEGAIYKATVYNSDGKKLGRSISFELSPEKAKLKK